MPPFAFQLPSFLRRPEDEDYLTPGFNPDAPPPINLPKVALSTRRSPAVPGAMPGAAPSSNLPELATPRPVAMPNGIPGGVAPPPPTPEPGAPALSRGSQLYNARANYLEKTPGRFKSALMGGLRGVGAGLASGQGLGGALGGFIGGAAGGAINPRGLREVEFNEKVKPQLLEKFRLQDQEQAAQIAAEKAAREDQLAQANIANIGSEIQNRQSTTALARRKQEFEEKKPFNLPEGASAIDPTTRQPIATSPRYRPPTQAQLSIEPSSGKSYEQIAEESYQGRGGDKYVFDRLPERTRQLLGGAVKNPDPREFAAAQQAYKDAIARERKSILDYTRGEVRGRAMGTRQGGSAKPIQGRPGRNAISVQEAADLLK